jgi:HPt (histidine-containing phosphotransfer) domain-containing protein
MQPSRPTFPAPSNPSPLASNDALSKVQRAIKSLTALQLDHEEKRQLVEWLSKDAAPPVDVKLGIDTLGSSQLFEKSLSNLVLTEVPRRLGGMKKSMQNKSYVELHSEAHALKASTGLVGAIDLFKYCDDLANATRRFTMAFQNVLSSADAMDEEQAVTPAELAQFTTLLDNMEVQGQRLNSFFRSRQPSSDKSVLSSSMSGKARTTETDVQKWICDIGFPQYADAFRDNSIDGDMLMALEENDLQTELGISEDSHRKAIMSRRLTFIAAR